MAKDFRADRVRIRAIVGTGSISASRPGLGLLIYSSSNASNYRGGLVDPNMLQNVGTDVWMFVSGSASGDGTYKADQRLAGGSVLFNGDVVVSGTLWAERSIIEVDGTVEGDLRVPNSLIQGGVGNLVSGRALIFADPATPNEVQTNRPGSISFKVVEGTAGAYNYPTAQNKDVFFHVSGSRGVKDTGDRGLALFDGDVHLSGNLSTAAVTTATFGGDVIVSGGLYLAGDDIYDSGENLVISFDGNGNLDEIGTIIDTDGLVVSSSSGHATIRGIGKNRQGVLGLGAIRDIGTTQGETIGQVRFAANEAGNFNNDGLHEGARIEARALETFTPTNFGADLAFFNRNPGPGLPNVQRLQLIEEKTVVTGNLYLHNRAGEVDNPTIYDQTAQPVLTLSGSGNATFNKNLTVVGDLNVSGSVTSIATDNLRVKDQLVVLASGSTGPNVKGGIAIASGSLYSDNTNGQALVFGAGEFENSWRASRLDIQDGDRTSSLWSGEPVRIETAGLRFKTNSGAKVLLVTSSLGGDGYYHITASNTDGDIALEAQRKIALRSNNHIYIDQTQRLYFDPASNDYIVAGGSAGPGGETYLDISTQALMLENPAGGDEEIRWGRDTGNKILGKYGGVTGRLMISGSGYIDIHANAPNATAAARVLLSGSSDEAIGGPVIILSSSKEYGGGTLREGFITIGATADKVDGDGGLTEVGLFTASRHRDVRTLLSGAVGTIDSSTRGVTLIAGDMVVSGNTKFVGSTDIGSIATDNLTLDSLAAGEPYIRFRDANVQIRRNATNHLELTDTQAPGAPYTLTQLASLAVTDNSDVFAVTHQDGSAPYLSYVASTGSFSFDHDPTTDGYVPRRANQIGDDAYFFVSGSIGSKDYSIRPGNGQRGTAVFGGDIHVSGSFYADVPTFWTTMHTAYSTPDSPGLKQYSDLSPGAGAVIDTNNSGIPLQLSNPAACDLGIASPGVNESSGPVLSLTGSLDFSYSGAGSNSRIRMQSNNPLEFHNADGVVFRLVAAAGGGNATHAFFNGDNQLRFNQDSIKVYGVHTAPKRKLKLLSNLDANSEVHIQAGTDDRNSPGMVAVSGSMHVSGSLVPNASSTYNLGSPDQTWANVYTGDLHLNNDRGSWTIYEEPDMLVVVNNLTGKKYKMGLTPLEDDE